MKKILLFLAVVVFPLTAQIPLGIRIGASLPANCGVGEIFYKTGTGADVYVCTALNTWVPTGSGVGGSQTAHTFLGGPVSGSPAAATFRLLDGSDLPLPGTFTAGGVTAIAQVPGRVVVGLDTTSALITDTLAASALTNGTSGSGAVCLVSSCVLTTPVIASFVNATHAHTNAVSGGQLTQTAINAANLQGAGTKFQMAGTVSGSAGVTLCTDVNGNSTTAGCSGIGGTNPIVSHTFGGAGEFGYVHNLGTLNPVVTCYDHTTTVGLIAGLNITTPATLTTTYITVTAAQTVDCAFGNGAGAAGAAGATGATGPAGPAPAGSGAVIVTGGVVSTLPGTVTGLLHGNASGPPAFSSVVTADLAANAVTSAKLAVANTRLSCDMVAGTQAATVALVNAQLGPENDICWVPGAATVVEVNITADGGTPSIVVGRNRAGSVVNLVSAALSTAAAGGFACANVGGTVSIDGRGTCSATLQNTNLNVGDLPGFVTGTAGGVAKVVRVHVVYVLQ